MTLTAAQRDARAGRVTASFLPYLMAGDEAKIVDKWRELVGDPNWIDTWDGDPWLTHYGSAMEPILLNWREHKTGLKITRRGEVVYHATRPWAACTLDGFSLTENAVIQAKTANRWAPLATLIPKYSWQVLWEVAVTGADRGIIYLSDGGLEPEDREVERDAAKEAEMWARAEAFNRCVETLTPPFPLPPVDAPVKTEKVADMGKSNSWAEHAGIWLATREAARQNESARREITALVPADAARAEGHGVTVSRNKAGHLSVRESKP